MSSVRTGTPADTRLDTAEDDGAPDHGLLENMSARPRTPIVRTIPAVRGRWVAFAIHPEELSDGRLEIPAELADRIEERWAQLGFTGATLLRPLGPLEAAGLRPETCPDRLLTLNIMLRARGRLLLEGVPPLENLRADETVAVATDDPLLVRAALPDLPAPATPQADATETAAPAQDTDEKDQPSTGEQAGWTGKLRLPEKLQKRGQR